MSFLKLFMRDSSIYTIPAILSRGIAFFLLPLYTRVLTPENYGAFDLFMAFGSLVSLTVALEISQGTARYYVDATNRNEKALYASTGFWFTIGTYLIFSFLAYMFSTQLSQFIMGVAGYEGIFRLGLAYLFANGLFLFIQGQLRWELKSKDFAIASMMVTLGTAILAVLLAGVMGMGLAGILLGMIFGGFLGNIYGLIKLKDTFKFKFSRKKLKEMLVFSLPLVPASVCVFIGYYADRIMINHYLSLDEVGVYGIGFRLASIVGLIMIGFQGALTPLILNHYKDPKTPEQIAAIFKFFIALALMMFMGLTLFAQEILIVISTPLYYPAAKVVIFLVPATLLSCMYIFAPGTLIAKKTHYNIWIYATAAGMNIVLNIILIPLLGISGAAIATLLSNVAAFSAHILISHKFYKIYHNWGKIIGATVFLTALSSLAFAMPNPSVLFFSIKILVIFIGIGILFNLKILDFKQLKIMYYGQG